MSKLTKDQVLEIQKSHMEGKTCMELSKVYGVSQPTISYHVNLDLNIKIKGRSKKAYGEKTPEQKKALTVKRKEYIKAYMNKRYKNDLEFRNKSIARQIVYNNRNKKIVKP